jgi:D-xylose transport system permease protein
MLIVLLRGMIDLSVGSGVGMLGGIACVLIVQHGWAAAPALLAVAAMAVVIWVLMGMLIIRQKVPAFIITLGGLLIFKGAHWMVIGNSTIPVVAGGRDSIFSLLTTYYFSSGASYAIAAALGAFLLFSQARARRARRAHGFPVEDTELFFLKLFVSLQALFLMVLVMNEHKGLPLALVILGGVIFFVQTITQHTRLGRYLYAIGGNEEAARLSGVPVERVVILAYMLLGLIVALSGFLQTAYGGYSTTTVGNLMELDAIAACVIGGTSLKGGRGSVLGVLFGALIMAVLLNGMTLLAVTPEIKYIARGLILVLAVWMDVYLGRKGP